MKIDVYYDKECPFCKKYAQILILKQKHELNIKNARDNIEKLKEFKSKGFDINDGIIIEIIELDNKVLQGSDAVIFLDKLDKKNSFYNNFFFRSFFYPCLKFLRFVLLKIFGKDPNIRF